VVVNSKVVGLAPGKNLGRQKEAVSTRFARFSLVQYTKIGKNTPNDNKK
jgi:hypothetical protein